jgi:hypothetical protein
LRAKRAARLRRRALQGSHEHFRTPLYTPLWIEGSVGVLSDEFSVDKWSSREIHKHIVARSLLCDKPSRICRAARSSTSADAQADRGNITNRKSLRRPGHARRIERCSERKFGSWRGIFLLGNRAESGLAGQKQISMEGRDHGETTSVSNCRSRRRLRRGE